MILRLSSNAQRAALVAASFALAFILSFFGIRNAFAVHYAGLQTAEAIERADGYRVAGSTTCGHGLG